MQTITVAAASVRNLIGQFDESIENMRKWTGIAAGKGAELILFPELNISGHIPAPVAAELAETIPGPSTEKVIQVAGQHKVTLCFGLIERDGGRVYCTHILVNGEGVIGKQRKIHVPAQERPFWEPGNAIEVFDIGKARVGITVCRDSFFDEMTRTLYFKGAEIVLMPFGYYNVPRSRFLQESIHGMSIYKASWTNGYYSVFCNSAEERPANHWEPQGRRFPGWAGVISPWGRLIAYIGSEGNDEALVVEKLGPQELQDRRSHENFLAAELRPELYQLS